MTTMPKPPESIIHRIDMLRATIPPGDNRQVNERRTSYEHLQPFANPCISAAYQPPSVLIPQATLLQALTEATPRPGSAGSDGPVKTEWGTSDSS